MKNNITTHVILCLISTILCLSSCVNGDQYDILGDELEFNQFIRRKKLTKDWQYCMNINGDRYPFHVGTNILPDGCLARALNAKFNDTWVDNAVSAIQSRINCFEDGSCNISLDYYNKLVGLYCSH